MNFFMGKENETVGVKKAKKKKVKAPPEKYFQKFVQKWFELYYELVPCPVDEVSNELIDPKPVFDAIEARQLKNIVIELRKRAEERNILWTEEEALKRFEAFIRRAWEDDFISKNFMLRIISNNRTKVFNNQITPKYDRSKTKLNTEYRRGNLESPAPTTKPKGGFGKL